MNLTNNSDINYLEMYQALKETLLEYCIPDTKLEILSSYANYVKDMQGKINLTSLKSNEDFAIKHFKDSLIILPYLKSGSLLDVGTGAGFPGVPLAITNELLSVTLLDSTVKKINFLSHTIKMLGITNVVALAGRAETIAHLPHYRKSFDYVVARAVTSLGILLELTIPFLKISGTLFVYKSQHVDEEINNALPVFDLLDCKLERREDYMLDSNYKRSLLIIKKTSETKNIYPREYKKILSSSKN
ncbi:MAG: 16S rRNA (guanine(527)-N(7))-methyltransferase RsmG [Christensenellaceae bacterium]|jgi:16S rRNA (guanine527-N7)-methyltransferase|nr:16S rRNA (guanine(527)-N(7))-methyltransferase RsmG [Christensenellaceae bacterium]